MGRLKGWLASRAALTLVVIALGVANAVALLGWGPLNPTDVTWIFGDNATYYTGWALFRQDSHVGFPLAWTQRVGYPVGASIASMDAMPIVAVLLRPFGPILPEPFQYLGPWAALCFALQAYFGFSLCRRLFPSNPAFSVLGSLFFVLSPALINRASGHTTLLTHWPILAGLEAYFRDPDGRPARWLVRQWIVLAIAAGITPYIAAMCLLVALAAVARLIVERRCGWGRAALLAAATVAVAVASGSVFGVLFSSEASTYWAPGYGLFSMNLNAPVNPMDRGSILLPPLPLAHPWQYEGYNYLGLGLIALIVAGLVRRPRSILWLRERRLIPLAGLALACTALAASTTITFGSSTLFEVHRLAAASNVVPALSAASADLSQPRGRSRRSTPLGKIATLVLGLRASGRLFWPAYYLLFAAALSLAFWGWQRPASTAILAVLLTVQFADLTPLRAKVRAAMDERFAGPLQSPSWKGLGRSYDNLILVPSFQCDPYKAGIGELYGFVWFGKLAAAERMRANSYYAARYTRAELRAHCVDLLRAQLDGVLDPRSAYVVSDEVRTVWALRGVQSARCRKVDGFNLCTSAHPSDDEGEPSSVPDALPYRLGHALDFTGREDIDRYLTFGWGRRESTGTWTQGPLALLRLGLEPGVDRARPLVVDLDALPLVEPLHPRLDVDVVVNGRMVGEWTFQSPSAAHRQARVPPALFADRRSIDVELRFRNPDAPIDLELGPPNGILGLKVISLAVAHEP